MTEGSLFTRFKDAARLKYLDPLDISNNYQCPIFVYEICNEPLSTYLLCTSSINVPEVLEWVKKQESVPEYNVLLNEFQNGWFTKTKSVFINDVRFSNLLRFGRLSAVLDYIERGDLKFEDKPNIRSYFGNLNRGILGFNYLPDYQLELDNNKEIERDCTNSFKNHLHSLEMNGAFDSSSLFKKCNNYGLMKYTLPPDVHFDQLSVEKDILLVLRPVGKNTYYEVEQSLAIYLDRLEVKSYQTIMYNADQFLLDMNNLSILPEYESDIPSFDMISDFKKLLLSRSSNILDIDQDTNCHLINIPLVIEMNLETFLYDKFGKFERNFDPPKCYFLSTTQNFDIQELSRWIGRNRSPQEMKVTFHHPLDPQVHFFRNIGAGMAFGNNCPDFEKFCEACYCSSLNGNDELKRYFTDGMFIILTGLKNKKWSPNFTKLLKGEYQHKPKVIYSLSKVEINDEFMTKTILILKQCNLDLKKILDEVRYSDYDKRMINQCSFLENITLM